MNLERLRNRPTTGGQGAYLLSKLPQGVDGFRAIQIGKVLKLTATLIIPAHNEAAVIGRLLRELVGPAVDDSLHLEIIVVCNGCQDRTAEIARSFGASVKVIETPIASKAHALNLGDDTASSFSRIYIDADVVIDAVSIRRLVESLASPGVLAASPLPQLDLSSCSAAVRRFYAVDRLMPSHDGGIGGSGVYALSPQGRARFGRFPQITADDAFVRRHFAAGERVVVDGALSLVTPPQRLWGLVVIKTRSHFGNTELSRRLPHLADPPSRNPGRLFGLAMRPWWWPAVATYAYVKLIARIRARRRLKRLDNGAAESWERDESSRTAGVAV